MVTLFISNCIWLNILFMSSSSSTASLLANAPSQNVMTQGSYPLNLLIVNFTISILNSFLNVYI